MAQSTKPTAKQYAKIVAKLLKAQFTVDTVYDALEAAGFEVELKGKTYSIYASRVIAMMHEAKEKDSSPLQL